MFQTTNLSHVVSRTNKILSILVLLLCSMQNCVKEKKHLHKVLFRFSYSQKPFLQSSVSIFKSWYAYTVYDLFSVHTIIQIVLQTCTSLQLLKCHVLAVQYLFAHLRTLGIIMWFFMTGSVQYSAHSQTTTSYHIIAKHYNYWYNICLQPCYYDTHFLYFFLWILLLFLVITFFSFMTLVKTF